MCACQGQNIGWKEEGQKNSSKRLQNERTAKETVNEQEIEVNSNLHASSFNNFNISCPVRFNQSKINKSMIPFTRYTRRNLFHAIYNIIERLPCAIRCIMCFRYIESTLNSLVELTKNYTLKVSDSRPRRVKINFQKP